MPVAKLFDLQSEGQVLVLALLEDVTSLNEERLHSEMGRVLAQFEASQLKHVVLDLQRAGYFGSLMLWAMNSLWQRARSRGGSMAICNVSPLGREVLEISHLNRLWPICASRAEALAAIAARSEAAPPEQG
jgi:anti-anti-sigma factor